MRRFLLPLMCGLLLVGAAFGMNPADAQGDPVPTLVPPTLVPVPPSGEGEIIPSESAVARIQRNGIVRVGVLFNDRPFSWLNVRGDVAGYEPDVARSMADAWGVDIEFIQVTRDAETTVRLLRSGEIDIVASALIHSRENDALVQFSSTTYLDGMSLMVRADDGAQSPVEMAGRRIGVVIQTPAQSAAVAWINRTGIDATINTFLTLDRAFVALADGRIDGLIDSEQRLNLVSAQQPDLIRILAEPVEYRPHAFAFVRQDVQMRGLVDRTVQYLTANRRMNEIYQVFFPGGTFDLVRPWPDLDEDAPNPANYGAELTFPAAFIVPQLQNGRALRVAGLYGVTVDSDSPESERRLDTLHRAVFDEIARRWGVPVEYVPDSVNNAVDLVAAGQADIAVGAIPTWADAERVAFTQPYLLRGERLLVRSNDNVQNFEGLRGGGVVATPNNESGAAVRAVAIAESINVRIEIVQVREQDIAFTLLEAEDAEVAFGDSVRLLPHAQAFPDLLRLTNEEDRGGDAWYSRSYVAFAVPRDDADFRSLVEYTLQEIVRDGTLRTLLAPVMPQDAIDELQFELWPGPADYLGFSLTG